MKVYVISWGYYSDNSSEECIQAIYSTLDKAMRHVKRELDAPRRSGLQQRKHNNGEPILCWDDGDYWIAIGNGWVDSPVWSISPEEYENL